MKTLVFEKYANNEIRIGWNDLPTPRVYPSDSEEERNKTREGLLFDKQRQERLDANGEFYYQDADGTGYYGSVRAGYETANERLSKLDIIREIQRKPTQPCKSRQTSFQSPVGITVFTRNARHRLLEAGAICDRDRGHGEGLFFTATLPGGTHEAYDAIARWSGYLSNRLLQVIRRQRVSDRWFYVWELQKRGALHLHLYVHDVAGDKQLALYDGLRSVWYRTIQDIGNAEGICMFRHASGECCTVSEYWQFDCQSVTKSVAAYLSKYVGKSANAPSRGATNSPEYRYCPRRWWGMSQAMTTQVNSERKKVTCEGVTNADIDLCMGAMKEAIDCMDAIATQGYEKDLHPCNEPDKVIGRVKRRIYWFRAEDFEMVAFLLQDLFCKLVRRIEATRTKWKYHGNKYCGLALIGGIG